LKLAQMMLVGREVPYAPEEAFQLLHAACGRKLADAHLFQAALAALGYARPQSFDEAVRHVAEAAALGSESGKGQLEALGGVEGFDLAQWFGPVEMMQHRAAPRIFTVEGFLPKPACAWMIKRARKKLSAAMINDAKVGGLSRDAGRSNSVAGSNYLEPDLIVQLANLRIAGAIKISGANQEPTNFLHYARGQEYRPHYDFIAPHEEHAFATELKIMGQRIVTVLVYLNEGYEGGETVFPRVNFRFKGKVGDALIFWTLSEQGEREPDSVHAGSPVTRGEKWLLSKWVREKPVPLL
jgi:predicted 2-oxoglutarate/Fe(II)-dependent dioxygenase YbiX